MRVLLEMKWQLAKMGSEPACSISVGVAKKAVRDWPNKNIKNIGSPQLDSERQRDSYKGPLVEEQRLC
jgi:hypothetical protein